MANSTTEPLDDIGLFFLSTGTDETTGIRSYSISVEKAEDSHYGFSGEAMDTLDAYLATRYDGTTLVERLRQFVADPGSTRGAESELRDLDSRLGLGVTQVHFDSYD
jgi:hypothetical protein